MASDYVDLAALKDALHITDTARDDLLSAAIAAASRSIDRMAGRRFWLGDDPATRTINPRGRVRADGDGEHLLVADIGSAAGLVVEVGSAAAGWIDVTVDVELEPADALDEGRPVTALLRVGWTLGQRVRVTARWGWPAVPDEVAQAAQIQAARLFKRKDSPEGVAGSAEWGAIRLGRVDPDVATLLAPYVLPGFA
ncbi:phage gp6-like head-tail connector protein [Candidatus Frankia alpina]|uniref:phage gp6-like head-tail connector protein n=1 Tax=Candidatus Frankia alpina TaxID=2699483 RepID=UPI0013D22DCA|nr:phage gp6-like head-tail connector protein [Candidatus Frankia alpina]